MDYKKWFKEMSSWIWRTKLYSSDVEDMYQAFKARLEDELTQQPNQKDE